MTHPHIAPPKPPVVNWRRSAWAGLAAAPMAVVALAVLHRAGMQGDLVYLAAAICGGAAVGLMLRVAR